MKCPKCGGKTTVLDTRHPTPNKIYRQRQCLECNHKFITSETECALTPYDPEWINNDRCKKRKLQRKLTWEELLRKVQKMEEEK